ncbi:MAG: parallel beta-helix domain-containing protein [Pseudomonadota bacterium]
MRRTPNALLPASLVIAATVLLAACGNSSVPSPATPTNPSDGTSGSTGRKFFIKPGPNATDEMVGAMIQAAPGDTIEFDCGYFELTNTFQLTDTEDVLVKGCGKDKTVLSFKNNNAPEGVLAVNVRGVTYQDFTVADTGGNGFELRGVDHATLQRVRAIWSSNGGRESPDPITATNFKDRLNVACTAPPTLDPTAPENTGRPGTTSPDYTPSPKSGRYGIYPVSSENILVDDAESIGASDAGIYVGQTNTAIIKNSRAAYNVFGFEIENVQGGEYANNLAECNTGGFLVYDLDSLRQYGDKSRMYGNVSRNNNTYNFTSGGIVGSVPPGSGMITLSYDRIDIFDNTFENNNTAGIIHTSYEIFPEGAGRPAERRIDWYTEGVHIFRNKFVNNGNALPAPTSNALQNGDVAKALPAVVGAKNQAACTNPTNTATCAAAGGTGLNATGFRGAHIVWDGYMDALDTSCAYPKKANGDPVPMDARGKPLHTNEDPDPACHYNGYKFKADGDRARLQPDWFMSCIDEDNDFSADSLAFANFKGTKGANAAIKLALGQTPSPTDLAELQQLPSSFDLTPHRCQAAYGKNLPLLPPVVIPPFVRSGLVDPAPAQALIDQLCGKVMKAGEVNFEAGRVNCPTLDQYNLFADPQDPTSTPNASGVPYSLNSKLFSDYSVKYRVLYLPPGTKAVYREAKSDGANAVIVFPVGTIIAKSFAFDDEDAGTENMVETRLLIKRAAANGSARWQGMSYRWVVENGKRIARLAPGGGTASVSWKHTDVDSGVKHTGSTDKYLIPNLNQCLSCHSREDMEPGSAPIGPKVRFMNKPFKPESKRVTGQSQHEIAGRNQIEYLCSKGLMLGCPENRGVDNMTQVAAMLEKSPVYNKPGSSGFDADSPQDIEARARAWLEVNCQHCHNVRGFAANTGFYVDAFRKVDTSYGICKRPTATGQEGSGGRVYDIHPGRADNSIIPFRIGAEATLPAARMPPIARSVVDTEAHALLTRWINEVVVVDEAKYPGSGNCTE